MSLIIPYDKIPPETLETLIEEFVTREGTDYGSNEASLATKLAHIYTQLAKGTVVIVYDEESESVTLCEKKLADTVI